MAKQDSDLELEEPVAELEPDDDDLLRTIEMNQTSRHDTTRPMQPVLEATTQSHIVPNELMTRARPTSQQPGLAWFEFSAIAGEDGVLMIPEELRALLAHRELIVRVKADD